MEKEPFAWCVLVVLLPSVSAIAVLLKYEHRAAAFQRISSPSSPCLPPSCLLSFRLLAFLYLLSILIYDALLYGPLIYRYYTQWSFTLLILYLGLAIVTSSRQMFGTDQESLLGCSPITDMEGSDRQVNETRQVKEAGISSYILQITFQTVAGAALLIDMVYWIFIYPYSTFLDFSDAFIAINMHAINLCVVLVEVFLNNLTFPWFRWAYFILWSGLFSVFTWTIHAFGGTGWPYPFMDVSLRLSPLWYFILFIGHIMAYVAICLIIFLKNLYLRHRWQNFTTTMH